MASNPSTSTYELVFHLAIHQPTSPKGHPSLASAQAARGAVLYQRTDTPSPPIQGKTAFHSKLLNLNQPTPIGPLTPDIHPSNLHRALTASRARADELWLLNHKINPGGQPRVNACCYASQLRRREQLYFPERHGGCKYRGYCAVVDKEDLDEGHRVFGRCAVSGGNKKLRDAVGKLREEREKRGRFRREVLGARAAVVAAASKAGAEAEVEVEEEEAGTSSTSVARVAKSEREAGENIAGGDVAARQDPSRASSIPLLPAPERCPSRLVAQDYTEIPRIILTDTGIEKEKPSDASTVLLPSRPKRCSSKSIAQDYEEIPDITVTDTEADEKKTSEASVVALPLRPKRGSRRLVAQDHTKIASVTVPNTEAEK